jgi:hypothetical protein
MSDGCRRTECPSRSHIGTDMVVQSIADSAHELANTIKQVMCLVLNPPGGGMKITAAQMEREHELGKVPCIYLCFPLPFFLFYLLCTVASILVQFCLFCCDHEYAFHRNIMHHGLLGRFLGVGVTKGDTKPPWRATRKTVNQVHSLVRWLLKPSSWPKIKHIANKPHTMKVQKEKERTRSSVRTAIV